MGDNPGDGKSQQKDANDNKTSAKTKPSTNEPSSKANKSKKLGKIDDGKKHEKSSKGPKKTQQGDGQELAEQELSRDSDMSPIIAKLQAENEKIMAQMMGQFRSEMSNLIQANTSSNTSGVGPDVGSREASQPLDNSNRNRSSWNDEYAEEQSEGIEIHAGSEFEEEESQSVQGERVSSPFIFPASQREGNKEIPDNFSGGSPGSHSQVTSMVSRDQEKEMQWASVLHQLPSYYDNLGEDLAEEAPAHKSYLADAFQGRRSKSLPRLPLDGMLKNKWESIERYMSVGEVSPCMSSTSKKFLIKEEDFEKYSRVPHIDQEYTAMTCVSKPHTQSKPGNRKASKTDPSIKDKNLRIAECDLQKCDESARVMLRAASHGSLILNAANTVLSNKEKFSPEEAVNLVHGAFQCMDAVTDCAMRITARSISARRRIYLSQVHFKDPNAQKDLMRLPMDGKYLFHGEFSQTMHKYATMARDAKETSDYVSSRSTPLKRTADNPPKGSTFKRPATFRQDNSSSSGLLVNKQGNQERQVSFKRDNRSNFPNKKPFFQKKGRGGDKQ